MVRMGFSCAGGGRRVAEAALSPPEPPAGEARQGDFLKSRPHKLCRSFPATLGATRGRISDTKFALIAGARRQPENKLPLGLVSCTQEFFAAGPPGGGGPVNTNTALGPLVDWQALAEGV